MIYIDHVHMVADSLDELHQFAEKIGLKRSYLQTATTHPHYDVFGNNWKLKIEAGTASDKVINAWNNSKYKKAIEMGAVKVGRKELLIKSKALLI